MTNQPPSQEQRNRQQDQRSREQNSDQSQNFEAQQRSDITTDIQVDPPGESRKKSGFKVGEETVTLGRAGEKNLGIEWIDVWVGNNRSVRFNVKTAPGSTLEVLVEQASYKRTFGGTGSVSTQVMPVAPIGTKGKITARDTSTGESLERPWTWISLGGWGVMSLWAAIKGLIWKEGG